MATASSSEKIGTPLLLCIVPIPLTLVPVYTGSATLVQGTHPVSWLAIYGVSRPGGNVTLRVSVGAFIARLRFLASASTPNYLSFSFHIVSSISALCLASALAHFFGPRFLPVVDSQGPSRCIVI